MLRRAGIVPNPEPGTIPVRKRTTKRCCAAPGTSAGLDALDTDTNVSDHSRNAQERRSGGAKLENRGDKSMKTALAILLTSSMALISAAQAQAQAQTEPPAKLIGYITLPNVEGWMDHLAVDVKGQRLFVPAEHQKTIEVVDLRAGKVIHTITGFDGAPRKTLYLPEANQIWVDDAESVKAFSADSYALIKDIPFELDKTSKLIPDNGAYDPATQQFYVTITADANSATATVKGAIEVVN